VCSDTYVCISASWLYFRQFVKHQLILCIELSHSYFVVIHFSKRCIFLRILSIVIMEALGSVHEVVGSVYCT